MLEFAPKESEVPSSSIAPTELSVPVLITSPNVNLVADAHGEDGAETVD